MPIRNYADVVPPTSIASPGITSAGQTSIPVINAAGFPPVPFTIGVDRGTTNAEAMLVTAKDTSLNTFTVSRGYDGTPAVAHTTGASVEHTFVAMDFAEANRHIEDDGRDDHSQYLTLARASIYFPKVYNGSTPLAVDPITTSGQQVNQVIIPSATFARKVQVRAQVPLGFGAGGVVYRASILRTGLYAVLGYNIFDNVGGPSFITIDVMTNWLDILSGESHTYVANILRDAGSGGGISNDPSTNKMTALVVPSF